MKIKVICQKCGKVAEVDTEKVTSPPWSWFKTNEVLQDLAEWNDWELWLCGDCNSETYDRLPEDVEKFYKSILHPSNDELGIGEES